MNRQEENEILKQHNMQWVKFGFEDPEDNYLGIESTWAIRHEDGRMFYSFKQAMAAVEPVEEKEPTQTDEEFNEELYETIQPQLIDQDEVEAIGHSLADFGDSKVRAFIRGEWRLVDNSLKYKGYNMSAILTVNIDGETFYIQYSYGWGALGMASMINENGELVPAIQYTKHLHDTMTMGRLLAETAKKIDNMISRLEFFGHDNAHSTAGRLAYYEQRLTGKTELADKLQQIISVADTDAKLEQLKALKASIESE